VIAVEGKIEQLSVLIKECEKFRPFSFFYSDLDSPDSVLSQRDEERKKGTREEFRSLRHRLQAAIHRFTTPGDSYRKDLNAVRDSSDVAPAESLLPIAKALRADLQAGWFGSDSELIHADMFSDLLEIACELHENGCKDGAAVQAGTALELHLRLLAEKQNIETVTEKNRFKGAGDLNEELRKAGLCVQIEQHDVRLMLATWNAAAHGKFDEYSADEVGELISGVREFVKSFPA